MAFFRQGMYGGGAPTIQPLILLVTAGASFVTLESSFFDFLLTEDGSFIVT
jgi:hypothetical protein